MKCSFVLSFVVNFINSSKILWEKHYKATKPCIDCKHLKLKTWILWNWLMHYRRSFSSFHRLVPAKLMRDWKALFVSGKPLYEQVPPPESTEPSPEQILEEERQALLDEGDFSEYKVKSHHMHFRIMHKKHVGFKYACRSFDNKFFFFFRQWLVNGSLQRVVKWHSPHETIPSQAMSSRDCSTWSHPLQ